VLVALLLRETWPDDGAADEDEDDDDLTALAAAFRDRRLAMLLIPVALLGIATSWIESLLPLYAVKAGTLTPSSVGLLFTYAAAIAVLFQVPVMRGSERLASSTIVVAGSLALAVAFAFLAMWPQLPFLVVAITCAVFSDMLSGPLTQTIATQLSPVKARATYLAAFSAAGDLKDAAGPAIGTSLYAVAMGLPWLVGIPLALTAGVFLASVAKRHEASVEDGRQG
jgi:predicted MFS family arabinose efflux permease